ncbi:MAG: T9SS type A sorting domain-containing protein [Crocinitomicaceae bacterium]|nr:T9SS type A sorting domain-containing protein [Crocinitomicaceae bacterium]
MKQIFTLISALVIGASAHSQVVFQSDLSSWAAGDPTDWMGSATSIPGASVVEATIGSVYGASNASLINTSASHQRFTTQNVTVTAGETYLIEMWVFGLMGQLRTGFYDATNNAYNPYNSYFNIATESGGTTPVLLSQEVTVPAGCTQGQFILSVHSTDPATAGAPFFAGIMIDSVSVSVTTPTPPTVVSIYNIQYATGSPADSPYDGQIVTTSGIVTARILNGPDSAAYFIQDGTGPWNGVYVYDTDAAVQIGDSVVLTGEVDEYFNLTEIKNVTAYTVETTGNTLPAATVVTTTNANMEQYEGVLLTVSSAECTNTTEGFGMWSINDGSGIVKCDDDIFPYHLTAVVGNWYMVTGVGHYTFSEAKILPRDINDISITGVNGIEEFTSFSLYPNPAANYVTLNVAPNAVVRVYDMQGKLILENVGENMIDVSNYNNGIYQVVVIENGTVSSQKLIVNK